MKIALKRTPDNSDADNNFQILNYIMNGNLGADNLNIRILKGITDPVADTAKNIKHLLEPQPVLAIPVIGDVYVKEITDEFVDVRSTKASEPFELMLIMGKLKE